MTDAITITIPGKPVPWARAGRSGSRSFNLPGPEKWKADARYFISQAFAGRKPFPGGVEVYVDFFFKYPRTWPKKRKERTKYVTNKKLGDLDRLLNLLYDALAGIAYHDDSQVVISREAKSYTFDDERVEVDIYPLEDG